MNDIKLRRPHIDDLDLLESFFTMMVNDTYQKEGIGHLTDFISHEIKCKILYVEEDIKTAGEDRFFLIAFERDEIVGTVAIGPPGDDALKCSNFEAKGLYEIGSVFVHPDRQNLGIGKMLINTILKELQKRHGETFCLDSGYSRAQKVWTHLLGTPTFTVEDYWGENTPHMVWIKKNRGAL